VVKGGELFVPDFDRKERNLAIHFRLLATDLKRGDEKVRQIRETRACLLNLNLGAVEKEEEVKGKRGTVSEEKRRILPNEHSVNRKKKGL